MRRILVLRGGALGDFIVTLPALAGLRARWPQARIELAGNAAAARLAVHRGIIHAAHSQAGARWSALYSDAPLDNAFATWLASFDLIVSFWPDPDGDLARRFPLHQEQRFVSAAAMPARAPAAAHYGGALAPLGVSCAAPWMELRPLSLPRPDAATDTARQARRARTIAIHPGSGSPRKNWPAERWIELIAPLRDPVLLLTGEAEADAWSAVRLGATPLAPRLAEGTLRLASNLDLEHVVDRLSECALFMGHDSGVSHLAAACGVRCVLLFGPTDPAMWAPPAPHTRVLRKGDNLTDITVEDVRAAMM